VPISHICLDPISPARAFLGFATSPFGPFCLTPEWSRIDRIPPAQSIPSEKQPEAWRKVR
jgi:hypothetical protein